MWKRQTSCLKFVPGRRMISVTTVLASRRNNLFAATNPKPIGRLCFARQSNVEPTNLFVEMRVLRRPCLSVMTNGLFIQQRVVMQYEILVIGMIVYCWKCKDTSKRPWQQIQMVRRYSSQHLQHLDIGGMHIRLLTIVATMNLFAATISQTTRKHCLTKMSIHRDMHAIESTLLCESHHIVIGVHRVLLLYYKHSLDVVWSPECADKHVVYHRRLFWW